MFDNHQDNYRYYIKLVKRSARFQRLINNYSRDESLIIGTSKVGFYIPFQDYRTLYHNLKNNDTDKMILD